LSSARIVSSKLLDKSTICCARCISPDKRARTHTHTQPECHGVIVCECA
jgi:hypothetical protein